VISERDLVVMIAGTPYHGVRRGGRGLADALSRSCDVLYVDPPVSPLTGLKNQQARGAFTGPRLTDETASIQRLVPTAPPGMTRPAIHQLTRSMLVGSIRRALSEIGRKPWAAVQSSPQFPVLGRLGEHISVYRASDDFTAGAHHLGSRQTRIAAKEQQLVAAADVVVVVSPTLAMKWKSSGKPVVVLPNGVNVEAFADSNSIADPTVDMPLDKPVAGVVGTMSERLDLGLLEAVAQSSAASLLLVGPETFRVDQRRFEELTSGPNVHWVGQQPFEDLPAWYRHIDVGLVPYTLSPFNLASDPLKLPEYLAAGKPVVATPLPTVTALESPDISVASEPEDFVAAISQAVPLSGDPDLTNRRRAFAARYSWDAKAAELLEALRQ